MNALVPIAMFGWLPLVVIAFRLLPPHRAVIAAYMFAWLFLPIAHFKVIGVPDYDKTVATSLGVFFGVLFFDTTRLARIRFKWLDLPMLVWCGCPFVSSLVNGLGPYDGSAGVVYQSLAWGIPYLVGRLYLSDLDRLKDLAIGIFIGGLVYVPLCLYEIRMSPQLHSMVYGFHQHDFAQTMRGGGWRPTVFMPHGLVVGMWMAMSTLIGIVLWRARVLRSLFGLPMGALVATMLVTTVLVKSFGAFVLLIVGVFVLYATKVLRNSLVIGALVAVPLVYVGVRGTGIWSGEQVVGLVEGFSSDRAGSMQFRLDAENRLAARALQQPIFGWGGWGRNFVARSDEEDAPPVIGDGLWVLTFGTRGAVGLGALLALVLLPIVTLMSRFPPRSWSARSVAPAAALAVMLCLYMIDCLANAMVSPIFMLASGGLTALFAEGAPSVRRPRQRPARIAARASRTLAREPIRPRSRAPAELGPLATRFEGGTGQEMRE